MLELLIDRLDEDGRGIGRAADGRDWHVSGALPGETVRAHAEHESPHAPRGWARLEAVIGEPSPDRVAPACPAHGRCGGCALQHLAYPAQLAAKRARVAAALGREVEPVVPAPAELGYRNKAKYVIGPGLVLGSYAPASHELVDMAGCRVPEPPLDRLADAVRAALTRTGLAAYDEPTHTGELRHVVLRANHEGRALLLLVTRTGAGEDALAGAARELMAAEPALAGVVRQENPARGGAILGGAERVLAGAAGLDDQVGPVRLRLSASAFFQVNRAQAARLYAHVADELQLQPGGAARVVDLYCGVGGIALTLAARGARVIGVESSAAAVDDARASAIPGADFLVADAAAGLAAARATLGGLDALVVNPPRKGLSAAARAAIAVAAPPRLVYVSCGPASLARDLAELPYTPARIVPFDLMPGTPQVETVVTLEHRG